MSWKASFNDGISSFRSSLLDDALQHFNKAIELGGDQQYLVYDSRAAVYEKLEKPKDALRDARKVIELAKDRWQGYGRAARLFLQTRKLDASLTMVTMALERIKADDTKRRFELLKLQENVLEAQRQIEEHRRRVQYHFGKLPIEIFAEIFRLFVSETQNQLLILLHVNKGWRDIAWNIPALWDTLVITHRNPSRKVALWVIRSKGRIRELRVRAEVLRNLDWPFDSLRGLEWDRLRICKIEGWDLAQYLESISMSHILSTLEDLQIDDLSALSLDRRTLFLENSGLRALTMSHCNFSWSTLSAHVENLRYLAARSSDGGIGMFLALKSNPNLETLLIESCSLNSALPVPSYGPPLLLSKLTDLELEGADASVIFEYLYFQHLRRLCIYRVTGSLDYGLCDATGKGLTSLTELCISRCSVSPSILIALLHQTMSLETLELSHLSYTVNQVIEALTIPLPASPDSPLLENSDVPAVKMPCPSLTHLNVSHSPDIKTGPLVRLIRSRLPNTSGGTSDEGVDSSLTPTVARIVSLTADGCSLIEPDWLPWFRKNVQNFSCIFMTKKAAAWKR